MNIKLRYAKKSDVPVLKNLWQICFGDRMRYIDVFFEEMFSVKNTLVAEVDGKVAGVVYVLNLKLHEKEFMYGYAIGVFPEYRGNSICETMLNHIKKHIDNKSMIFGLHPANDKLTEFYKKIGLREMYSLKIVDATNFASDKVYSFTDISADEFGKMRSDAFKNCVLWDKNALAYILKNGESVKKINIDGHERYIVVRKAGNMLTIKETTMTDDEIKKASQFIKESFKAEKIIYHLQNGSSLDGEEKYMIYGFSDKNKNVYMNLFLD